MKKLLKKLSVLSLSAALVLAPAGSAMASTKTDAENMLKYYKQGNISKAKKYNSKLPKKADKTCIKNLSKKAKAAYRKIVLSYDTDRDAKDYIWGYYLADLDGDKKAELLVKHGSCEADVVTFVYTYKNGKAKKLGKSYAAHGTYYAYPKHSGVILGSGIQGVENTSLIYVKKGKLKEVSYGSRELDADEDYFPFRQALYDHAVYNKNYEFSLDLKDLK